MGGPAATGSMLRKEALATVGLGWILAGLLGALPFLFAGVLRAPGTPMHPVDALFESVSGFTTTGASVLTDLETPSAVPRCVLFWRSFTHWLGGMGIIVLFVAILGQLGAAGKALMRREVPGPIAESVRPRVRETAIVMWGIYVGLSVLLTCLLVLEGLSFYDSLCHTFGTMATGGFSTFNASVGHFRDPLVEATIIFFMVLAGTNFSLYYMLLRGAAGEPDSTIRERLGLLLKDPEFRLYLSLIGVTTIVIAAHLWSRGIYVSIGSSLRHSLFAVVSVMTTTGYGTEDFAKWTQLPKAILLVLMFVGGCAGSTGGGVKVIRMLLIIKVLWLEIERAFRPKVVRPLRLGNTSVDEGVRRDMLVYAGLVTFLFVSSWLMLVAIEPDHQWMAGQTSTVGEKLFDCATAVAANLNNIGPGLGEVGPSANYSDFSALGKLLLTVLMLLGRLELYAVMVLLFPSFWRTH